VQLLRRRFGIAIAQRQRTTDAALTAAAPSL